MGNERDSKTDDRKSNSTLLYLKNLLKKKEKNWQELEHYITVDNINNMLMVSLILMLLSVIKIICKVKAIWGADSGIGLFLITLVYSLIYYFIHIKILEDIKIQKYIYISFWIFINLFGLKYLYMEIQIYHSIIYFYLLMYLITGFYISSFYAVFFIILDSVIAIKFLFHFSNSDIDIRVAISVIVIIAFVSMLIMIMKYYHYTKDKWARITIRTMGGVDCLTNLLNRRGFEDELDKQWALWGDLRKAMISIMIDIDNFKTYNDTYGHIEGDQCLKDISECIYDIASRKTDFVVRYGGEEIVVVFTDMSEENCIEMALNIQERINGLQIKAGKEASYPIVTVSMGIASMAVSSSNTIYDLIDKADEQLYLSKNRGRNRITINNMSIELNRVRVATNS